MRHVRLVTKVQPALSLSDINWVGAKAFTINMLEAVNSLLLRKGTLPVT